MNRAPSLLAVTPPLPPTVYLRPRRPLPYPFGQPGLRLQRRARRLLHDGALALGLGMGDVVLLPAWHHGSEVEALIRAGIEPRFYGSASPVTPDPDELGSLLDGRVRALHLIHSLGLPQDAAAWRRWCDERGLLLIEDAAQAWLATDAGGAVGRHGDLAIYSLYKSVGVPDGGAARLSVPWGDAGPSSDPTNGDAGLAPLIRPHAGWLLGRLPAGAAIARRLIRSRPYDPAADFRLDPAAAPSRITRALLGRLAGPDVAARRRTNYRRLVEGLRDLVPEAFRRLPTGASPFAFPIEVGDKPVVLAALLRDGIRGVDLWSVPHPSLPRDRFPAAAALRARLIGLPVHQELHGRDVERIVAAVRRAQRLG